MLLPGLRILLGIRAGSVTVFPQGTGKGWMQGSEGGFPGGEERGRQEPVLLRGTRIAAPAAPLLPWGLIRRGLNTFH